MGTILTHNADLGVFTANQPPGLSCPGRSPWCVRKCYAKRGRWCFKRNAAALLRRHEQSKQAGWVAQCVNEARLQADVVRIHSAGDFYNRQYIRQWGQVADRTPNVQYYAYTRVWRCGEAWADSLRRLDSRYNVTIWLSVDPSTAHEARPKDQRGKLWRTAWVEGTPGAPAVNCAKQLHKGTENCRSCRLCYCGEREVCFHEH